MTTRKRKNMEGPCNENEKTERVTEGNWTQRSIVECSGPEATQHCVRHEVRNESIRAPYLLVRRRPVVRRRTRLGAALLRLLADAELIRASHQTLAWVHTATTSMSRWSGASRERPSVWRQTWHSRRGGWSGDAHWRQTDPLASTYLGASPSVATGSASLTTATINCKQTI